MAQTGHYYLAATIWFWLIASAVEKPYSAHLKSVPAVGCSQSTLEVVGLL